jgi:hypothetical protein
MLETQIILVISSLNIKQPSDETVGSKYYRLATIAHCCSVYAKLLQIFTKLSSSMSEEESAEDRRVSQERKRRAAVSAIMDRDTVARAQTRMRASATRFSQGPPDAFKVISMSAEVFRGLCAQTLDLKLSKVELGALVLEMYGMDAIERGAVNSADFIRRFLDLGVDERARMRVGQREREEAAARRRPAAEQQSGDGDEGFDFTEADEARAIEKLTVISSRLHRGSLSGSPAIEVFESAALTPTYLRESTKALFGVNLSKREANAILLQQSKGSARGAPVSGLLFLRWMLKLGDLRRAELRAAELKRRAASSEFRTKYEDVAPLQYVFTRGDLDIARDKLRRAALQFSSDRGQRLGELYSGAMHPSDFRALLRRELQADFSPAEAAALASQFVDDHQGNESLDESDHINGSRFVASFLRVVGEERRRGKLEKQQRDVERREAERARSEELSRRAAAEGSGGADFSFTEEDRGRALAKLSAYAAKFEKHSSSAVDLGPFEGLQMTPAVLRQMLLRIVGLKLTAKELGVVVREFGGDKDTVSSSVFLSAFVRAGTEQRVASQLNCNYMYAIHLSDRVW